MHDIGLFGWIFLIPIIAVIGGMINGIVATSAKARVRELEIRERIAMIERGLVPSPETDPKGFEQRMQTLRVFHDHSPAHRFRTGGIVVISVGFGLMTLLWFVGVEREALGVGGFLVILGLGLLVNSLFPGPGHLPPPPSQPPSPPASQS